MNYFIVHYPQKQNHSLIPMLSHINNQSESVEVGILKDICNPDPLD